MSTKIYTAEQIIKAMDTMRDMSEKIIIDYEDGKNAAFNSGVYKAEMEILKSHIEHGTLDLYF